MLKITLVLPRRPDTHTADTVRHLAAAYAALGHDTEVVSGSTVGNMLRLLRRRRDVFDFHGAHAAWVSIVPALFKHPALTVCTLHDREEFRPGARFIQRLHTRLGRAIAARTAAECITTNKMLQYTLLHQYGKLPTYIPQGVSAPNGTRRQTLGLRHASYLVAVGDAPAHLSRIRALARSLRLPQTVVFLSTAPAPARRTRTVWSWDAPERDALLARARAIIVPEPLWFPGMLRQLALAGRPIVALDTAEHREALHGKATFVRSPSRDDLRAGLAALAQHRAAVERRATRAAQIIARLYTWDEVAREVLKVYRRAELAPAPVDSLLPRTSASRS